MLDDLKLQLERVRELLLERVRQISAHAGELATAEKKRAEVEAMFSDMEAKYAAQKRVGK